MPSGRREQPLLAALAPGRVLRRRPIGLEPEDLEEQGLDRGVRHAQLVVGRRLVGVVPGRVAAMRGQLVQVADDRVAGCRQLTDPSPCRRRGPVDQVGREQDARPSAGRRQGLMGEHLAYVVPIDRAGQPIRRQQFVDPPDHLGLRATQADVRAFALQRQPARVDLEQAQEPLHERRARRVRWRHGDQVNPIGRQRRTPSRQHVRPFLHGPEPLRHRRLRLLGRQIGAELRVRELPTVLDALLPLGRDLPPQVTRRVDDMDLAVERLDGGLGLLGRGTGEHLVRHDDVAVEAVHLLDQPRPGADRLVLEAAPRLADQVERGQELMVEPLGGVEHALRPQPLAIDVEQVLQLRGAGLGRTDVDEDLLHCGVSLRRGRPETWRCGRHGDPDCESSVGASACTTRDGLGRPSCSAIQTLMPTSASRSTPCSMPRPVSSHTRSSEARLPVALSAYGQPPSPPAAASKGVNPARIAASTLVSAWPYVSWKCIASCSSPTPTEPKASISAPTWPAVPTPIVSPRESWVAPRSSSRCPAPTTCSTGTTPSHGSPKHIDKYARTSRPSARARMTTGSNMAYCSSRPRLRLRRANDSVALPKIAMCVTPAATARSRPRSFGTSTGSGVGPARSSRSTSSAASASCVTDFGWTKLVASTIGSPAAIRRPTNSAFTSSGTIADSFCSPSRGPTS